MLQEVAEAIKKEMDMPVWSEKEVHWQVVVGHIFGSSITHNQHFFMFAKVRGLAVLLFHTSPPELT